MSKKVALVTGGFDPIHNGHIRYFIEAKKYADILIVGLNSEEWLTRKKGHSFMPWKERAEIIQSLQMVDKVIEFNDDDESACDAIKICLNSFKKVIFINGGDRQIKNTPELLEYKDNPCVDFEFGVGGNSKINSSSWILEDSFKNSLKKAANKNLSSENLSHAPWGTHEIILGSSKGYKVKKINVNPGHQLSLQYHKYRSEHWVIVSGSASVELDGVISNLAKGDHIFIPILSKHRIKNISEELLVFIEVNIGDYIEEDDIVRITDNYGRIKK
tara:strand:- start:1604 stop:2422 length:819 start_codon:yes stop_codon:yes gene_type:complete